MKRFGGFLVGVILGGSLTSGALWFLTDTPSAAEAPTKSVAPAGSSETPDASTTSRSTQPRPQPQPPPPSSDNRQSQPTVEVRRPTQPAPASPRQTPPPPDLPPRKNEDIEAMVERNEGTLNLCYQLASVRTPSLQGTLTVRIGIAADGRVTDARITNNSLRDDEMERCILVEIRSWRFEPALAEYVGSYTFSFTR